MKLLGKMMISCKKATALIEKKQTVGISIIEKLQLGSHALICKGCQHYERQSLIINDLLNNYMKGQASHYSQGDLDKLKNQIIKKIEA